MYTVEFYEKADGNSELWDFLEDLRKKAANNKCVGNIIHLLEQISQYHRA